MKKADSYLRCHGYVLVSDCYCPPLFLGECPNEKNLFARFHLHEKFKGLKSNLLVFDSYFAALFWYWKHKKELNSIGIYNLSIKYTFILNK